MHASKSHSRRGTATAITTRASSPARTKWLHALLLLVVDASRTMTAELATLPATFAALQEPARHVQRLAPDVAANAGFSRPDSVLFVVAITDEDESLAWRAQR
jgi:Mg-chelatase subunit ChlD